MSKKSIFKKKKNNILLNFIFFFTFILIFFLFIYFIYFSNNEYFFIKYNNKPFYTIPYNKEGKQILNLDKKGLHLSYLSEDNFELNNDQILNFSIQLIVDDDYSFLIKEKDALINLNDSIFSSKDLFIANLNTNLGNKYFLLYKNFDSRKKAQNYCEKYAFFTKKCLIVNVKNLE
tara:strand:- start:583 stop:1107 length:525 start_codon:yes stop_codon:yes gene_type:complete